MRTLFCKYTALRKRYVPGRILTVPPPHRTKESTAACTTFSVDPTRSAFCGPTVIVRRSFHSGSTRLFAAELCAAPADFATPGECRVQDSPTIRITVNAQFKVPFFISGKIVQ